MDAQEQHNAIWRPILAAHRVAAALRSQADLFASLPDAAKDAWIPGLSRLPHPNEWAAHLRRQADAIELAAPLPITPTEEDMQALFEMYCDCLGDVSSKDRAWEQMDQMTEADKAEAIAQMTLDEMLDAWEQADKAEASLLEDDQ